MTLIKKKGHALVKLVDDSRVPAFLAEGFEVLNVNASQDVPGQKAASGKPVNKMTVDELRAYAAEKSIALPDGGLKADLLAAIEAAENGGAKDGKESD